MLLMTMVALATKSAQLNLEAPAAVAIPAAIATDLGGSGKTSSNRGGGSGFTSSIIAIVLRVSR